MPQRVKPLRAARAGNGAVLLLVDPCEVGAVPGSGVVDVGDQRGVEGAVGPVGGAGAVVKEV